MSSSELETAQAHSGAVDHDVVEIEEEKEAAEEGEDPEGEDGEGEDEVEEDDAEEEMYDCGESTKATKASSDIMNDTGWDTDLEIEVEKSEYDFSGPKVYMETCRELGVLPVSYFVRHMKDERLEMKHHGLGPLGAKALAIPLFTNTYVCTLDLEDNWLEGDGASYLAEMLKENCYISCLTLAENRLGSVGAASICDMLLVNTCLTYVNLSANGFQDKDAPYFAKALLENNRIRELILSRNDFGSGSGDTLGHAIGENESLEILDLSWNHFRGKAALDIVDAIKVNARLKRVNLSWNGLGNEGMVAMADCLRQNHVLLEIDVSNNRVTPEGAVFLGKGLDANETLKVLKVGKNPLGPVGAITILTSLSNERSVLEELNLTDVCVDKDFDVLHKELLQSRQLNITHGGLLSDYVIKGSPKKKIGDGPDSELSPETLAALHELGDIPETDPLSILQVLVKSRGGRLLDLLRELDKTKDFRIPLEDFRKGLEQKSSIKPSDEQFDSLVARLDKYVQNGGFDYRELCPADDS